MPRKHNTKADVVIIGGGLSGLTISSILAQNGLQTVCIDQNSIPDTHTDHFDGRTTAISAGSKNILERAGVWEKIERHACPIQDIQILDNGSPVLLEFLSQDVETDAFGWILENLTIRMALAKTLKKHKNFHHIAPAKVHDFVATETAVETHLQDGSVYTAPLVIGADGKNSFTREWMGIETRQWSYDQNAIVCVVGHENPHNNIAIEHFRPEGPFAVLPMQDDSRGNHRSSIVWTEHGPLSKSFKSYDDETFNLALNARFPEFYGEVRCAGPRYSYPLSLTHAHSYIGERMALIADAGHAIHPIAGQGLNLGFRDINHLTNLIIEAHSKKEDTGSQELLKRYERSRRLDNMAMVAATDTLNRLFSNNVPPVEWARQFGLKMVANIAPARKFFMRQAMGFQGKRKSN